MEGRFVAYYRVSTAKQGASGLGLDAQKEAVARYLNGGNWELLGEYEEVETGKRSDRPALMAAMEHCRRTNSTLIIAKLDRLARNVAFVAALLDSGVTFVCCDMPDADRTMLQFYSIIGEREARMASERTKAALGQIKAKLERGETHVSKAGNVITSLGNGGRGLTPRPDLGHAAKQAKADAFAGRVGGTIADLRKAGLSMAQIADRLNEMKVQTPRGGKWAAMTVKRVMDRVGG